MNYKYVIQKQMKLNYIMIFPKQLFFLLIFLFPLLQASNPNHCSSSSCHRDDLQVRFPLRLISKQPESCGYPQFNLNCTNNHKTSLKLPNSETFLVREINYINQEIRLYDAENCLAKKLLTFDTSKSSPFSALYLLNYTFLICSNEIVKSLKFDSIKCLGNSTVSFLATTSFNLAKSMLSNSCEIFKTLAVPVSWSVIDEEPRFSSEINDQDLWLKWDFPNCRSCEKEKLRCGFLRNDSLQVKCYNSDDKSGKMNTGLQIVKVVSLCIVGPIVIFAMCITIGFCTSERFGSRRRRNLAIAAAAEEVTSVQPTEFIVSRGLDENTIESYKKMELGESKRLPGVNDTVCSICLTEYAKKDSVRCLPECDHCFHVECIDVWLKIHGSCPICRNSPS